MKKATLENFLTSTSPQSDLTWEHFIAWTNSNHSVSYQGKSLVSYLLYPYPGSWLADQLDITGATPYAHLLARSLADTRGLDFLKISTDDEGNHPLHYALINRGISMEDYLAVLRVMTVATNRYISTDQALTEARFMERFVASSSDGTFLYTAWLHNTYNTKMEKKWYQYIKNSSIADLTTKKFDQVWQWSNQHMLKSKKPANIEDPEVELVDAFLQMTQKKPITTLEQCPNLYHKVLIWGQKLLNQLQEDYTVDWGKVVHMEGENVAVLTRDDCDVQSHHRALHNKMEAFYAKASSASMANVIDVFSDNREAIAASVPQKISAGQLIEREAGSITDRSRSGLQAPVTGRKRQAAMVSQHKTQAMLMEEDLAEQQEKEAAKKPSPTSFTSFWYYEENSHKRQNTTKAMWPEKDDQTANTSGESDSSSSNCLRRYYHCPGTKRDDCNSRPRQDDGGKNRAVDNGECHQAFAEVTQSIVPQGVFNAMHAVFEGIDSKVGACPRGLWRLKKGR